jgi:hypothetical protein
MFDVHSSRSAHTPPSPDVFVTVDETGRAAIKP